MLTNDRLHWLTPAALVMLSATPGYAVEYLSIEQAQRLCFPKADQFAASHIQFTPAQIKAIEAASGQKVLVRGEQVWKATQGGRLQGFFIVDYVIGKHLAIDYAVALSPDGAVRQIEILQYRESYGGEIRNADWRKQFAGKTARSPLALNSDIRNISGATLSCRHVTEGVKRVLATYELCLK
ncbi:MAG TPA: FMN-binding protein [Chthoniobacteraceae bacterium]|nr:FMN-binding protein [Chthoniobacteraceae bacterium]